MEKRKQVTRNTVLQMSVAMWFAMPIHPVAEDFNFYQGKQKTSLQELAHLLPLILLKLYFICFPLCLQRALYFIELRLIIFKII